MAGDWIKMRSNLWDDPRVSKMCDLTNSNEATVIGGLYWLWSTADQHSVDGLLPGLTLRSIDRKTAIEGFADALIAAGWLENTDEGVVIVRFEEHNGKSAKRRCSEAVRKMSARDADKLQTDGGRPQDENHPPCAPREREEKEVNQEANASVAGKPATDPDNRVPTPDSRPPCPADDLIALYHELMPLNPCVKVLNDARRKTIRARWKEAAGLTCAPFGYDNRADGLKAWRQFFEVCADSDFLTGRAPPQAGRPPFLADIDFLMSPKGFAKCLENKYHRGLE
jgi:hypothetical protein